MNFSGLQGRLPQAVFNQLQKTSDTFEINTNSRLAHFLGQCDHESMGFTHTLENLNYSAEALLGKFSKYFTPALANDYARKPEKIGNRLYANRMGNGNEASGDGWKHRGMGYIQLTGKSNHDGFFKFMGMPAGTDPSLIATTYPLLSAAYFWHVNNLNQQADNGVTDPVMVKITKVINGGNIGLKERTELTLKYNAILSKAESGLVAVK